MNVNKVILIGRVGKDPEFKTLDNGTNLISFSLATSEKFKKASGEQVEQTDWHNIVGWSKVAEIINQYVKKGDLIYIDGKIKTRIVEAENQKKYYTEIHVNQFVMLSSKNKD